MFVICFEFYNDTYFVFTMRFTRIDADERVARNIERHVQRGKRNKPSNYGDGGIARSNNFLFELKSLTEKSKKRSLGN